MVGLKHTVHEVLEIWNQNVAKTSNTIYTLEIKSRKKEYFVNKKDSYKLDISELLFISTEEKDVIEEGIQGLKKESLLLYRKELQVPEKVKGVPKHQIYSNYEDQLYKYFLYECIGAFALLSTNSIKSKDYAPYDISKDRLIANEYFKDHIVEAIEDGAFYKAGDQFDVFTQLEGGWAVFTAHEAGIPNNGIAKIDGNKCKVIQETTQKIELIKPKKVKLIL